MKYQTKIAIVAAVVLALAATSFVVAKSNTKKVRFEKVVTAITDDMVWLRVRSFGFYIGDDVDPDEKNSTLQVNIIRVFYDINYDDLDVDKMRVLRRQLNEDEEMHIDSLSFSCDQDDCP